ncbi:MAG: hypothetical protein HN976_10050 [Lentisphaerae bacterium]|jgi:diaminopimelate decarboxylase|nr:hypothetical protein [Lentisphaerota bacterium]MBT7055420.1 hypothetical protein [Lentisphaerota bacterium]
MAKAPPNHHIPVDLDLSDETIVTAAESFGTPLYIYSRAKITNDWMRLKSALPSEATLYYSVKANPSVAILQGLADIGASFEVASEGELRSAECAGIPASKIIFLGPGKRRAEIAYAVDQSLSMIVAESPAEVSIIREESRLRGARTTVALRINPGAGRGKLVMGGMTQFGMSPTQASQTFRQYADDSHVEIVGVHGYLAARVLAWEDIVEHSRVMLAAAAEIERNTPARVRFVDLGGGFGIPLHRGEDGLDLNAMSRGLSVAISEYRDTRSASLKIAFESGRYIVGPAGVFVARVVDVKSNGSSSFVLLDGGTNVFPSHMNYAGARLGPLRVLPERTTESQEAHVCGPLCTPTDRLARGVLLPMPQVGDLLAFYQAGAYGLTASPTMFLGHGAAAEVLYVDGRLVLVRDRQSIDHILALQHKVRGRIPLA